MYPSKISIQEVGPREGFQYEGIGCPDKISTQDKCRLISALTNTGLKRIQATSFVSPKRVPQMADAEELSRLLPAIPGITYTSIYLNDKGFERMLATGRYLPNATISFTASDTFSLRNQGRDHKQDIIMQHRLIDLYRQHEVFTGKANIMAAFGCNYEGDIPAERIVELVHEMHDMADEAGITLDDLELADTMGWGDPQRIKRTVGAVRERWPQLPIALHLHDTRGLGIANVHAALEMGITRFDTSVGGLGGCPFSGSAAGNVATEDVVFMCQRLGIETEIDISALVACTSLAESIVGHPLPSRLAHIQHPPAA